LKKPSFITNKATISRDIYIKCANTANQINETLFHIDLREGIYNRTNAIWGYNDYESDPPKKQLDLPLLILTYQAETIFVKSSFKDGATPKACGNFTYPCSSLGVGLSHLVTSFDKKIYVQTKIKIESGYKITDVEFKTRESSAEMEIQETIEQTEYSPIFSCENICEFGKMKLLFPTTFSETSYFSFFRIEGALTLFNSSFESVSNVPLNFFFLVPFFFLLIMSCEEKEERMKLESGK
jgi:hypothetical protein